VSNWFKLFTKLFGDNHEVVWIPQSNRFAAGVPLRKLFGVGRSQPTKSEVLLHAVGSVRLSVDEEYDIRKHSFGLKIWLVPLR
jgi:hypothetical protein